ncbi:redoxin domain-containing protein [uncultured Bacteroides sp.]|uniref:redoxin domain-containing protein n=1 Tax=uncultured Bacteroides sp. TaxID=162156 RepID=UPI0025EEF174|nr:redoxin domain-containing protein [uncultured Bacteroides sp.]
MKRFIAVALMYLSVWALCAQTTPVKLSGEIEGLNGAEVVLLDADRSEVTRVKGKGDKFSMRADVVQGDGRVYYLYVPSLGKLGPAMNVPYFYFFIDNDALEVKAEIKDKNLKRVAVKHSAAMDEYDALYRNNPYQDKVSEVGALYNEAFHTYNAVAQTEENLAKLKTLSDSLQTLYGKQSQAFLDRISSNKESDALFLIVYSSVPMETAPAIEAILQQFDADFVQRNYYAKELQERLRLMKGSEVGSFAPDFELKDAQGNPVKLSSLRGQYVLIDFWASWCGPCRKELPNVKKIWADYKDKGLQVLGVSIDKDESKWRKAVGEEQLEYLQLWDPSMTTGRLYNYSGIPFIVLIGPDGKILARQLRGEELRRKVSEHIDSKPFEISVNLSKPYKGKVFLTCVKERFTKLDSLQVDGTSFSFKGNIAHADQYRLMARPFGFDAYVCVEPGGRYRVDIEEGRKFTVTASGGKEQLLMNELLSVTTPIEKQTEMLANRYSKLKEQRKDAEAEQLQKQMSINWDKSQEAKLSFIKEHPESFVAMLTAGELLTNDYTTLREVYELVDTVKYAYSYSWRSFRKKYREAVDKWIQNKKAPDFVTKDMDGNTVRLSDFKGKYLLLDFWASWCRPCRAKMKELKEVYPRLRQKGIVVCSISLDEKREQWEKATREDGIVWANTCDLKPFRTNEIALAYKVTSVPTLFVIDPQGIIISQNPSVEEILQLELK